MKKLALAAAAILFAVDPAMAQQPPNIIVIMLDDVPDDLSIMPRTTALLSQGARYANSFTHQPLCGPSRATFLTGQEGVNNGVIANGAFLADLSGLMPQALQAAGYTTGMFGKSPNGFGGSPVAFGFDHWATLTRIGSGRYENPRMDINGEPKRFSSYTTDVIYGEAEKWIKQVGGTQPYFAWISAVGGHAPNIPAARYRGACDSVPFTPGPAFNEPDVSDKPSFVRDLPFVSDGIQKNFRNRCATLRADDEWIDRLVRGYAAQNTCIFLTADNGFLHGQHRITGKNYLYEESIRVPLVLWGCGVNTGVNARLVSNVDLPATIIELAGATPGRPLDGRSIFGTPRTSVALRGIWSGKREGPRFSLGVREDAWSYFSHDNGEEEMYDLGEDPRQLKNIATRPPRAPRQVRYRKMVR